MRQLLLELHTPGKENPDFFIVNLPSPGEPNFYRQVISFSFFRSRELKRAFPDGASNTKTNGMNWMQYAKSIKYCTEASTWAGREIKDYLDYWEVDINNVPVCENIWDFYDKIGYDRKTQKYRVQ